MARLPLFTGANRRALTFTSSTRRAVIPPVNVPALTSRIAIHIPRPTTLNPIAWGNADTIRVSAILEVDGTQEHVYTGRSTGGVRKNRRGLDAPEYVFSFKPTWGFFGVRQGLPRRLGELANRFYRLRIEVDCLAGALDSEIEVFLEALAAPQVPFHSSAAFDAATDGNEINGDGVMSISHTASGADRAAFAGNGNGDSSPQASTSITYAGNGMTEKWDLGPFGTFFRSAGYTIAGDANVPTGAQTVTSTLAGASAEHAMGVITATGVDSADPVTAAATATGTASPASVTVLSVPADALVVDSIWIGDEGGAAVAPTAGANQTGRNAEVVNNGGAFEVLAQSTQLGSDGGVMSWSWGFASEAWGLGAIAFKPAGAAGGDPEGKLLGGKLIGGGLLTRGVLV